MYQVSNQLMNLLVECYTKEYANMSAEELLESDYIIRLSRKIENVAKTHIPKYAAERCLQRVLNNEATPNQAAERCRQAIYTYAVPMSWRDGMIAKIILSEIILADEMFEVPNAFDIEKEVEAFKASFITSFNAARQSA
nr:MAG TPA: hypothetical protein [Caudoviricetes sp.]